jgi:hypothetical protein
MLPWWHSSFVQGCLWIIETLGSVLLQAKRSEKNGEALDFYTTFLILMVPLEGGIIV